MPSLAEVRETVADAIIAAIPTDRLGDIAVAASPVDAMTAPGYMVEWGDPMLLTRGFCLYDARIVVRVIGPRIDVDNATAIVETMLAPALLALHDVGIVAQEVTAPAPFEIGGVTFLAARVIINQAITVTIPGRAIDGAAVLTVHAAITAAGTVLAATVHTGAVALHTTPALTAAGTVLAATVHDGASVLHAGPRLTAAGTVPAAGPWTPLALPGIVAWWDASDTATITASGGLVSSWANKKAGGPALVQGTGSSQPLTGTRTINGLNVLDFFNVGPRELNPSPESPMYGASAGTVLFVWAVDNDPPTGDPQAGAVVTQFGNAPFGAHQPYTDGVIYDDWGSSARVTGINPAPSLTSPHVYCAISAPSDWRSYLDGVAMVASGSNSVAFKANPGPAVGGKPTFGLDGRVAEIIMCWGALSTADRNAAETYLRDKWWDPSWLPGLVGWWDASDASTITASAGRVSQWRDKSGNGYHLVQAVGAAQPMTGTRTLNGLNAIDCDWVAGTPHHLSRPPSTPMLTGNTVTVAAAFRSDTIGTDGRVVCWQGSTGSDWNTQDGCLIADVNGGAYQNNGIRTSRAGTLTQSPWPAGTTHKVIVTRNAGTWTQQTNGTPETGSTGAPTLNWANTSLTIGGRDYNAFDGALDGLVGEVIVTSQPVTGTDLARLTAYLNRWG